MRKFAALACVLLCCGGCSAVSLGPNRVVSVDDEVAQLPKVARRLCAIGEDVGGTAQQIGEPR